MQLRKYHNDPPLYNKYTLIKNKTTKDRKRIEDINRKKEKRQQVENSNKNDRH
jgi:hypothetical protein